jgi:hypothetical protein
MISAGRLSLIAAAALLAAGSADPILQSTYLGGSGADSVDALAVDPRNGDIVVAGLRSRLFRTGGARPQRRRRGRLRHALRRAARHPSQATYLGEAAEEVLGLAINLRPRCVRRRLHHFGGLSGTASGAQPAIAGLTDGFVAHLHQR